MQDSLAVLQHPKVDVVISPQRPLIKKKRGFCNALDSIDGKEWLIRVESQSHTVILPNPSSHDLLKKHALSFACLERKRHRSQTMFKFCPVHCICGWFSDGPYLRCVWCLEIFYDFQLKRNTLASWKDTPTLSFGFSSKWILSGLTVIAWNNRIFFFNPRLWDKLMLSL